MIKKKAVARNKKAAARKVTAVKKGKAVAKKAKAAPKKAFQRSAKITDSLASRGKAPSLAALKARTAINFGTLSDRFNTDDIESRLTGAGKKAKPTGGVLRKFGAKFTDGRSSVGNDKDMDVKVVVVGKNKSSLDGSSKHALTKIYDKGDEIGSEG
jgi:hypothetical protein